MAKIGIIGAMELEVDALKAAMEVKNTVTRAGMEFKEGTLNGADVVVVRSGIGKVNAALCVQILVDLFQITHVINTGVAGSLNADLDIGDILISKDAIHHDVDATVFGYPLGELPQMGIREFIADEKLVNLAVESCKKVNPDLTVRTVRVCQFRHSCICLSVFSTVSVLFAADKGYIIITLTAAQVFFLFFSVSSWLLLCNWRGRTVTLTVSSVPDLLPDAQNALPPHARRPCNPSLQSHLPYRKSPGLR